MNMSICWLGSFLKHINIAENYKFIKLLFIYLFIVSKFSFPGHLAKWPSSRYITAVSVLRMTCNFYMLIRLIKECSLFNIKSVVFRVR